MRAHQITKNQMMAADKKITSGVETQKHANLYVSDSSPFPVDATPEEPLWGVLFYLRTAWPAKTAQCETLHRVCKLCFMKQLRAFQLSQNMSTT